MSLLNPLILYGLGLAAVPVILHFLMRPKPKRLVFPALRLINARRNTNRRRMRLRHIWLLLLRILVIVLLVLALARPSLPAADYSPTLGESLLAIGLLLAAGAAYAGLMHYWRRQGLPQHVVGYRRAILRGLTGAALLLLFLLLVAWPYQRRIAADISTPQRQTRQKLPVAAVFLFDTSPSMGYRLENQTRLEAARGIGQEHLDKLPAGSRVAVAGTASTNPMLFQAEHIGAGSRIESLETQPAAVPLNERLRTAIELQEDHRRRTLEEQGAVPEDRRRDRYLREIYLFTDLQRNAWQREAAEHLQNALKRREWLHIYVIDVGVEQPADTAITSLELSRQTVPVDGSFIVRAGLQAIGAGERERTVELHFQDESGNLVKQGEKTVTLAPGAGKRVTFSVQGVAPPVGQGEVRLIGADPLSVNDTRYFTVGVHSPPEVLLVAQRPNEAVYWREALAPAELRRRQKADYRCTLISAGELAGADLQQYEAVCLINVAAPEEDAWEKLAAYVESGGGLAVFLGHHRVDPVSYNSEPARQFLPAELLGHISFPSPQFLDLSDLTHPMLGKFEGLGGTGELTSTEVRRCWRVEPTEGAAVIAPYTDNRESPALLEKSHGRGRTVLLTTAVNLDGWSDLPLARWSFVALADQMMQYLAHQGGAVFNYTAGEEVTLPLEAARPVRRYLLRKPSLQQLPGEVAPEAEFIALEDTDQLGHYELVASQPNVSYTRGFSVNLSTDESDLSRLSETDLEVFLGEQYSLARKIEELEYAVRNVQIGRPIYPVVLLVLIVFFCVEHIVANRFYAADQAAMHA